MEIYANYSLTPSSIASLTGIDPLAQRELRRRGVIDDFGECRNDRWYFSLVDAVALWAGNLLAGPMFSRDEAYRIMRDRATSVIMFALGLHSDYRYFSVGWDGGNHQHEQQAAALADLTPHLSMRVIDLAAVAAKMPSDLLAVLRDVRNL